MTCDDRSLLMLQITSGEIAVGIAFIERSLVLGGTFIISHCCRHIKVNIHIPNNAFSVHKLGRSLVIVYLHCKCNSSNSLNIPFAKI